ncbi:protein FAR1-RELATED SEQUENCE 5-like [Gastrolobium bilobum]|uniref:protein FAR1-RELATED SEQUENCE 5-like n=1 Tax=Gastrolobium bilobum TaxID=150636 RepID=UPI002AB0F1E2|nr:protein FAR1-RELATED SEQUENCE 5-like [Gastrolobium bilobum]
MDNFIYSDLSSFSSDSEYDNEQREMMVVVSKDQDGYEPKIGMMFSNEDEAYKFYNGYAKLVGFTVRKSKYRRLADGTISQRTYDTWIVSKFIADHNHDLVKSFAGATLRSQRHVDEAHANVIEDMGNAGLKQCSVYSYFVEAAGGAENVGFLKSDSMDGLQPKTIFVDQCQAMANAIKRVLPRSQHRLCLWHIGQNAAKHLSYYLRKPDFKVLFNRCLYNCGSKKFESVGLLCLHALKVLNFHNIFEIPSQYILKRWTKNAKDGLSISNNGI